MSNKPVYKYKDYVDIDNIVINQETGYRYSLFIPFKKPVNKKYILIIMRNPSKANKSTSDKTINNVLGFCHNKYGGVYMANLYPYYETKSRKLKDFVDLESYKEKMEKNSQALEGLLKNINDIIVAWGTNNAGNKYRKNYENTVKLLSDKLNEANKNVYAMRFISSKNPWHPRNWEKGFNLELYPWDK